ncbi:MAG: prepilin peptidase [Candidatus Kerfeldbacteria bacterium]|nr:prepilin peptidase [Candidatus Kerfeldbacteria bacterium]
MTFIPILLVAFLGLALGSFLNAFIWRFVRREKITGRHSMCVHCKHRLAAADLVPIASFVLLRGRCRYCRKPIPWHYPVVELATALVLLLPLAVFGLTLAYLCVAVFSLFLELLFLLDLRYSILPDSVTVLALLTGAIVSVVLGRDYSAIIWGAILGAGFFGLQYALSRGAWIGGGDIRLGAAMGAALGWQLLLIALALAYWSGAGVAITLVLTRRKRWKSRLPFGTFLSAATYLTLLAAPALSSWAGGLLPPVF